MPPPTDALQATLETMAANTRWYREQREITQSKLAAACGVELRHLQRVESAEASPSLAMVVALAVALDIPVASLFQPAKLAKRPAGRPQRKRTKA